MHQFYPYQSKSGTGTFSNDISDFLLIAFGLAIAANGISITATTLPAMTAFFSTDVPHFGQYTESFLMSFP